MASATNTLIETSDGVISGRNSLEQLIVASNDVAASTAQLVAASRVKATFMSKTQDRLENASKAVGTACRTLVRQVQEIISERNQDEQEAIDYTKLSSHEFEVREMEQQVCLPPGTQMMSVEHHDIIPQDGAANKIFLISRSRSFNWRTTCRGRASGLEKCERFHTKRTRDGMDGEIEVQCLCIFAEVAALRSVLYRQIV